MVLSAQTIRRLGLVRPFREKYKFEGVSGGLSHAGYDIAVQNGITVVAGMTSLAVSDVEFIMPKNVLGRVHDKSTWARRGVTVQTTVIEPGWRGFLTIELQYAPLIGAVDNDTNHMHIPALTPIAQIVFEYLDADTESPYAGKYQDQPQVAVAAIFEG